MRLEDRFHLVAEQDAAWISARLRWHKLLPLAASLADSSRLQSPTLGAAFQDMLIQNLAREQNYLKQLKDLFGLLEDAGIEFIPFKGPFWGTLIYPQYSWRHIGDIDLIMNPESARRAATLLEQRGYLPEALGENIEEDLRVRGELACHPAPDARHLVTVELHWEVMPAPRFLKRHFMDADDFLRDATIGEWKSIRFPLPTPEVRLLYYVLHATCQHQFNRLALVVDMAVFIAKHPALRWRALLELAKQRGCVVPLHYGLEMVNAFVDLPDQAREIIRETRPGIPTKLATMWLKPRNAIHFDDRRGRMRRKLFRVAMSW